MTNPYKVKKGDEINLLIEKLIYGGDGLSHFESRACFVNGVVPGEKVVARVIEIKSHYLVASPIEIISPSENRKEPECPIYQLCGGCQWQHIKYRNQLYWKTEILKELLLRIANIKNSEIPLPLPSPSIFNYRCRAVLKIASHNKPVIGYYQAKTHNMVSIENCLLLSSPLNKALGKFKEQLKVDPDRCKDIKEMDMILMNHSEQVLISLKNSKQKTSGRLLFINSANELIEYDEDTIDEIMGINFRRDTEGFYQVNYWQNIQIIKLVLNYFEQINKGKILDLYCGSGNFSLFLAREAEHVTGIDSNGYAVSEAIYNAEINNIKNCDFVKADLNKISIGLLSGHYDGVLINPPRAGCSKETLIKIANLKPEIIVYVSCNPSTLARDLAELVSRDYETTEIQPVDMFPQTFHIETVVKLVRNF